MVASESRMKKLACLLVLLSAAGCSPVADVPVIDCHVHLYDTTRPEGLAWPRPEQTALYRPHLPEHIIPMARKNNVLGLVAMQAGQTLGDNQWNLDIIANEPLFKGVIGNLSTVIGTDQFKDEFSKLCENPRYLGYRLSGKYQDGLTPEFFRDLRLTAETGKPVDVLIGTYTLDDVATIAREVPDLRIMIDHIGNIRMSEKPDEKWVAAFKRLGEFPNVSCKISGLYSLYGTHPAPRELSAYRPAIDLAVETFGFDRLIFSSDWPVTEQTADYTSVINLVKSYFQPLGNDVLHKVLYGNALKFYRIPDMDAVPPR
jgi:predicted TIM-barrel fold metal-dependent hydrolase